MLRVCYIFENLSGVISDVEQDSAYCWLLCQACGGGNVVAMETADQGYLQASTVYGMCLFQLALTLDRCFLIL